MLGASNETIRRWCRNGVIPGAVQHARYGGTWRIPADVIEGMRLKGTSAVTDTPDTPDTPSEMAEVGD